MGEAIRLALAVAAKDIRLELRSRTALLSAVVFAALVLVVFNFARDPTAISAMDLAPSVLWVTFAFGAVVALNRAFTVERENAALDGMLLAPLPRSALYLGKLLANLAFVFVVEAVTLPLFVLFFNVSLGHTLRHPRGDHAGDDWFRRRRHHLQRDGRPHPVRRAHAAGAAPALHGAAARWRSPVHRPAARRAPVERDAGVA
jgi:hypothetical protein